MSKGEPQTGRWAQFAVGMVIRHRLFDYRGVIADVDPQFSLDDDWYARMASSRPPKDAPWYHVLVDGSRQITYVAERNLQLEDSLQPIQHPAIQDYFLAFEDGRYRPRETRM